MRALVTVRVQTCEKKLLPLPFAQAEHACPCRCANLGPRPSPLAPRPSAASSAMAFAPAGVVTYEDRAEAMKRLRNRILLLPPRCFTIDDISALTRAFARMAPRPAARTHMEGAPAVGLDAELLQRFSREVRHSDFQVV